MDMYGPRLPPIASRCRSDTQLTTPLVSTITANAVSHPGVDTQTAEGLKRRLLASADARELHSRFGSTRTISRRAEAGRGSWSRFLPKQSHARHGEVLRTPNIVTTDRGLCSSVANRWRLLLWLYLCRPNAIPVSSLQMPLWRYAGSSRIQCAGSAYK